MNKGFPNQFLWGASTSAYQVEGDNKNSDWWKWETEGAIEPSGIACDHYNRFKEDFKLAKDLGHNAHRMGLEWSRLEKENGVWDQSEWDHYKAVIDELIKLGMEPVVTLNHFTVPQWFADKNSWLNDDSVELFSRFAAKAIEELGDKVNYWITINEPNILAIVSYFYGDWTPCGKDFNDAIKVLRNMIKGHVSSYIKMTEVSESNSKINVPIIGIAKAVTAFHPCTNLSIKNRLATFNRSSFHNFSFISSLIKGYIDLPGIPEEKLDKKYTLDFIGLNYYFRQFIHSKGSVIKEPYGEVCSYDHHTPKGGLTDMGWEIYPEGIYEVVKAFSRFNLPIMITENGLATEDDSIRKEYIKSHLTHLLRAINDNHPVIGYLHWSLLDNFEWAEGYSKRFGLIEVDYKSQKRTIRDSARYYGSIIRSGNIQD